MNYENLTMGYYGNSNVILSARNDNSFYMYNKDTRNSTSSIVDKNNSGVVSYKYDDFGNTEVLGDETFDNEICYTGGIYDKETGELYLNARFYDPSIARFTTVDTYRGEFEEPLSLNLYTYCSNNPANFIDPTGHNFISVLSSLSPGWKAALAEPSYIGEIFMSIITIGTVVIYGVTKVNWRNVFNALKNTAITISLVSELMKTIAQVRKDGNAAKKKYKYKYNKHHIVPKFKKKPEACNISRGFLKWADIGIDSVQNKVKIKTRLHVRLHRNVYHEGVNNVLMIGKDFAGQIAGKYNAKKTIQAQKAGIRYALFTIKNMLKIQSGLTRR